MPTTDPPKTDLPAFEMFCVNMMLKLYCAASSDDAVLNRFESSGRDLLRIADDHDIGVLSQQILIPRLVGMQDSSRNWSVLMVLEHLATVNRAIMEIIRSLRSNHQPFETFNVSGHQPDEDVGAEAIERFRETNGRYWSFAKSHRPLRSGVTHRHPWFGELDGHAWHCVAAAHQNMHRRQVYKILAMIGIA